MPEEMNPDPCQVCAGTLELNEFQVKELRAIAQKEKVISRFDFRLFPCLIAHMSLTCNDLETHRV